MTGSSLNQKIPAEAAGPDSANSRDPAVLPSLFIAALIGVYLLLTSTTNLIPGIWLYDAKRILQFFLLLILFLVPVFSGRVREEFGNLLVRTPTLLKITLPATFLWGVVSVLVNTKTVMQGLNSFSELALLFALVLGVYVVAACRRIAGRSFDRLAIGLIALTGLAVGLQELIGVVAAQNAGVDFNFRIALLHFSWPRFYNQVQSWTIPALVALPILFSRYRLAYFVCALVLALQWYVILATGARGSFVSIGAAVIFALIFLPAVRPRLFTWQTTGFLLGALIFALVTFSFERANTRIGAGNPLSPGVTQDINGADTKDGTGQGSNGENSFFSQSLGKPMASSSGRTWMWLLTLEDIRKYPVLGIGPMNYVCTSYKPIGHPHNFPLQLASEWGIPVAVAVTLAVFYLLWQSLVCIRSNTWAGKQDDIVAGLLLTGILAAGLHACLSGIMVMPASQVTGLLVCGMLAGLLPASRHARAARTPRVAIAAGILSCVFLLGIGSIELSTMQDRAVLLKTGDEMWPRMWQDSKVCRLYTEQNEVKN